MPCPSCVNAHHPLSLSLAHRLFLPLPPIAKCLHRYLMEFPQHFAIEDLDLDGVAKVTLHKKLPPPTGGSQTRRAGSSVARAQPASASGRAGTSTVSTSDSDASLIELLTLKQQGLDAENIALLTSMDRPLPMLVELLRASPKSSTTISRLREALQQKMRLERTIKSRNLGAYLRSFWEVFEISEHIVPDEQQMVREIKAVIQTVTAIPKDKGGQRKVPSVVKKRQGALRLLQGLSKDVDPVLKILTSTQPVSKSDRQVLSACNKPLQVIGLVLTLNRGEMPLRDLRTSVQAALGTERTIKGLPLGLYLEHFRKHFMVQKKQPNMVRLLQAVSLRKEHVVRLRGSFCSLGCLAPHTRHSSRACCPTALSLSHSPPLPLPLSLSLSLFLSHSLPHSLTLTFTHSPTLTRSHSRSLSHTHTL